jgi:lysophospholipase L1-like esterase
MALVFQPGQTLLFIGDSITDCGRRSHAAPYGEGYVSLARALLLARHPELPLRVINQGIGGNRVIDLAARWEEDVIAHQPAWLTICIGINDVWRAFDGHPELAVPLDLFAATYRRLLDRARAATQTNIILMEPYLIEPSLADPMRRAMDSYGALVRELAEEYATTLVHTQAAFDAALATTPATLWANDRIHPNLPGHSIIALAWLRAVGFSSNR